MSEPLLQSPSPRLETRAETSQGEREVRERNVAFDISEEEAPQRRRDSAHAASIDLPGCQAGFVTREFGFNGDAETLRKEAQGLVDHLSALAQQHQNLKIEVSCPSMGLTRLPTDSRPAISRVASSIYSDYFSPNRRYSLQNLEVSGTLFHNFFDAVDEEIGASKLGDRREFLVALAASLLKFGAATHLTEAFANSCSERLQVPAQFSCIPSMLFVSFNSPDMNPAKTQSRSLALEPGMILGKLDAVDELAGCLMNGQLSFEAARQQLNEIILTPPPYNKWHKLLAHGMLASSATLLFFGGGWWDGLFSFILGLFGGAVSLITQTRQYKHFGRIEAFITSFLGSFCARFFHRYAMPDQTCFFAMSLGVLTWHLPGLTVTTGVTELASNSIVSGSSRMFASLTVALQLGFGLSVGSRAILWDEEADKAKCSQAVPDWFMPIGFLMYVSAQVVLMSIRSEPINLIGVYGAAAGGFITSNLLQNIPYINADIRSFLSAVAVGIIGGVHSRLRGRQNLSSVVCGLVILVPGGLGLMGVKAFLDEDVLSGLKLGFQMFSVSLSITIGLLVAKVFVFPVSINNKINYDQPSLQALM